MRETFNIYNRKQWSEFSNNTAEKVISETELKEITSLGDRINLADVTEIYQPLVEYLHLYFKEKSGLTTARQSFLHNQSGKSPFIIGISGSVAVGKSTTARLIDIMLKRLYPKLTVQLITTDGFLYSNSELEKMEILDRKGFPESYDMNLLYDFMSEVTSGKPDVVFPEYSHESYDILPGKFGHVRQPDILIVEGINVLQLPANQEIYLSDFFDFSLYLDADEILIEEWFISRFEKFMAIAQDNPDDFYYNYAKLPPKEALDFAHKVWNEINLVNLREYIAPTKSRANMILHKTKHHQIDQVLIRKY